MASLESCKIAYTRGHQSSNSAEVIVAYNLTVANRESVPFQRAVELGQSASGSNDRIRQVGEGWDLAIADETDVLTELDRIDGTQKSQSAESGHAWTLFATYRSPNLRQRTVDPSREDPRTRNPEFWVDSVHRQKPRDFGENLDEIKHPWVGVDGEPAVRAVGTSGPVTNAAGFRYGEIETITEKLPLFCVKTFTTEPFAWVSIDDNFGLKVNSEDWNVFGTGQEVSAGSCLFYDIQSSHPMYWGNITYYELVTRVLYNRLGHDIRVRNEGDKAWQFDSETDQYVVSPLWHDGIQQEPPFSLTVDGEARVGDDVEADIIRFRDLERTDFSGILAALQGA